MIESVIPSGGISTTGTGILKSADGPSYITFESNTVDNAESAAILIDNGDHIATDDTTITADASFIRNPGGEIVVCEGSSRSIGDMTVQDPRTTTTSDVEVAAGVEAGAVVVSSPGATTVWNAKTSRCAAY